ncbi:MAG TPA: FAD-dependent oxidoreductase [Anaerolineae bacterium]|nr:FAD-dependent oxidoreductase [Anaerolineae bacterium]
MKPSYDVIIIGGGLAGLALAYQLARRRVSVLLLEANTLGSGTSGASAGRAQVSEGHRGLHMQLVQAGLARLEQLEAELEAAFEWRRLGNLMLIEQAKHWRWWTDQVAYLTEHGFTAEILDRPALQQAEPLLRVDKFLGAAWCLEGHLNPLKLCQAYARAARRHGAQLEPHTAVTGFAWQGERSVQVCTPARRLSAGTVVVTAGAWSGELLARAGINLPVQFTHAEAIITEPLPPVLHHHVGLADFYETIHNQAQAVSIGLAQQQSGTLLITEAVHQSQKIHRRNSAWGLPAMARELLQLFPGLTAVRVIRSWAAPSPFLPDEQPAIGWLPGPGNLFVATCFHLTITTIPVLSELMAGMILGEPAAALAEFNPARF